MVRNLTPADAFGLMYFSFKAPSNEARPRDRVVETSASPRDRGALWAGMLAPERRRYTWVLTRGGRILALASSRRRSGASAWEVERLMAIEGGQEPCQELLEKLAFRLAAYGAQRLFLRLPGSSPFTSVVRKAGFACYQREYLLRSRVPRPSGQRRGDGLLPSLRPRTEADQHALFRLYSSCIPADVRAAEGMTLSEWQEARERVGRHACDLVLEERGCVRAWLTIAEQGPWACLGLLAHGEERTCEDLVDFALCQGANKRGAYALVPEYNGALQRVLLERGFETVAEFAVYVKPVAARERVPCLLPAGA